ncbi:MAG: discoidin domain-containing protein, partial [Haloferula sp.]
MKPLTTTWLIASLILGPLAKAEDVQVLEAKLKEHLADSPEAAELMLTLLQEREASEDVFGVIKTAGDFVRAQSAHPRRAEVMVRLIEGYAAGARHGEVVATGTQFFEIFPKSELAVRAHRAMAEAHEELGQWHQAAKHWAPIGLTGDPLAVKRALDQFDRAENAQAGREGAEFTLALLKGKAAEPWAADAALMGMELAGRGERWETGAAIGKAVLAASARRPKGRTEELWYRLGGFESRLGNHKEAVAAIEKSLAAGRKEYWGAYMRELGLSKAPPAQMAEKARELLKQFPAEHEAHAAAIQVCDAWLAAGNPTEAAGFAESIIRSSQSSRDLVRKFVVLCADDHARAESVLRSQVGKSAEQDPWLREVLAVDLYQTRMKDSAKSRQIAFNWLEKSPAATGADRIVASLIDQAADESTVASDLQRITQSGLSHPHIDRYWQELWRWRSKDSKRNKLIEHAKREFEKQPLVRNWQRSEKGGKEGVRGCDDLLKQSLTADAKRRVMKRRAYLYRYEMGEKLRPQAHALYRDYCKANPKDWKTAEAWLEAAQYAGDEAKLEASRHLISLAPCPVHPDARLRVVSIGDANHRRKAVAWAGKCARLSNSPFHHSGRIGKALFDAEMPDEARRWWRQQFDLDPSDPSAADCLVQESRTLEPDAAIKQLRQALEQPNACHGPLSMALADRYFRAGKFEDFSTLLARSRSLADKQPFRDWHVHEWPAKGWLEHTAKSAEIEDADKSRIYRAIFDLRLGRLSAEAGVLWAGLEDPSWKRIADTQLAMRMSDRHHEAWHRFYPRASSAILRRDMTLAAAILNGLIHSVGGVDEKEMDKARARLRTAYARMGSLGTDIPEDSPIAPLLEIVLHLRLGDMEAAENAYFQRRALFDKHITELPIELLLFAAGSHVELGGEADHQRAEELLRGWLIKNGESDQVATRDKARVQLLLAKNYLASQRYDVARSEYTTLINLYPDEAEVVDAKFGIGETYMAQDIGDQAEEIFADLATSSQPRIVIRAEFMRGLLAIRRDEPEEARTIFLSVLEKVPEIDLADSTLYHLAEVYGIEQRYLAQLETLRTVGRLGRESQRWLTPGKALAVVVQDPDLGISRGEMNLPVRVTTDPGGDVEDTHLVSGGAGRGIFLADIPSVLGPAEPDDGLLQVTGADLIRVDYPDEFKAQFKNQILEGTRIRIATDGFLDAASQELIEEEEESFTDNLRKEDEEQEAAPTLSEQRPATQVKPGNLIHVRVSDGDQDTSQQPDEVAIKLETSSGDIVRVPVTERSAHGGIFTGSIRTGELPAGAQASDTALDHSPLMAIDQRRETSWRSEPDGKGPKTLSVDMKEPKPVETITLESPDAGNESPKELTLHGSQDGRFWFKLAEHPTVEAEPIPPAKTDTMSLRVFEAPKGAFEKEFTWTDIVKVLQAVEPNEEVLAETLSWQPPAEGEAMHLVVWSGSFVQPRSGAVRFAVEGQHTALMFDGRLELPVGAGQQMVDVHAAKGVHELTIISVVPCGEAPAAASRARENRRSASVTLGPFKPDDFDLAQAAGLPRITQPIGGTLVHEGATWSLKQAPLELRHLQWEFGAFHGAGVAVNHMTIRDGDTIHVPTDKDVLELAGN